jgi:hypothetical protein
VPMLPLITGEPAATDHNRTIADPIGVVDATAFVGPVHYAYIITDSIGVTDATAVNPAWRLRPIVLNQAALVRAHYW